METVFPLTALSVGQQARIVRIEARGELARRIRDMGLGSGMTVSGGSSSCTTVPLRPCSLAW
ncbi:FeoA family protein [Desulfovibrio legallii]|uniref:FeoA family protein n=1 Tax=Desulfovibrio legallii TaxID=571438 RepID=UPI0013EF3361|nr:ferrous iron transport protein A [Desulfovibrio legallii]